MEKAISEGLKKLILDNQKGLYDLMIRTGVDRRKVASTVAAIYNSTNLSAIELCEVDGSIPLVG